jgi:hypothetical protein
VALLLAAGADVHDASMGGATPLHSVAMHGHGDAAQVPCLGGWARSCACPCLLAAGVRLLFAWGGGVQDRHTAQSVRHTRLPEHKARLAISRRVRGGRHSPPL